jgi:hypothetical protein
VGERLVTKSITIVNGLDFHSAPEAGSLYTPISLDIEYRDNETPSLSLEVWDGHDDVNFMPIFNSLPNPRCNENIPVEAYIGWEGETLIKAFAGNLTGKHPHFPPSKLQLTSHHKAFKLRKRGKTETFKGLTVTQMIQQVAAQEGLTITIDPSAAGDEALNTPVSWDSRDGDSQDATHWGFIYHWIHELGYVTTAIRENEIVVRADKETTGTEIEIVRGDNQLIDLDGRFEQKRAERASKRRTRSHQPPPGQFAAITLGTDCGNGRGHRTIRPSIGKKHPHEHEAEFHKDSNKGIVKRLEREGDELSFIIRMRPEMRNEESIKFSGYGPEIDGGVWETASVIHRVHIGHTEAACFRKH